MNPILLAVLIVTVIGLIGAVILVAASIFMYVPVDERVEQITGCLPGANCGACGCAGCADYAKTIVEDGNAVNKCVPGGAKVAGEIAAIMGVEAGASVPMKAVVACSGTCGKTGKRFEFEGLHSCQAVKGLYGGDGDCKFGCLGYGDCVSVCAFDAIHVVDGVALVDREKCTGCGACAKACPNAIISIIPFGKKSPKLCTTIYTVVALIFIFLGTTMSNDLVWELTDMFNNLMVIPNAIALFALTSVVVRVARREDPDSTPLRR